MSGIVVTGASGGIGRAIAERLATANPDCDLLIHYCHNESGARETESKIRDLTRGRVHVVAADFSNPDEVARFADDAWTLLGRVQTWINNAGVDVLTGELAEATFDVKLDRLWRVDVAGTIQLSRLVAPRMAEASGHLPPASMVFIGWDQAATHAGMEGEAGMMFGPIKAAVMSFAAGLAQTLAPRVRVNVIAPGWIRTAWGETTQGYWDQRARGQALMDRWGRPEDVAAAAEYLTNPHHDFVTGQVMNVNGGWDRTFPR